MLSFRHKKQTSKNVVDTTFKVVGNTNTNSPPTTKKTHWSLKIVRVSQVNDTNCR